MRSRSRRRGGRGRGRRTRPPLPPPRRSWWSWLTGLFARPAARPAPRPSSEAAESFDQQEARALAEFSRHFGIQFKDPGLLRLALTHRSYLSVTGMGPRESNERLEFLGDSVLGLVTSEYLYRHHPDEHEGQLTKTKSLLVSKAILSRRALHMGLGRFILLSHSEMESGGRKRASILADAFESVLGAIYLDQGFEAARRWVIEYLLRGSSEIVADKRHRNYKSQLQEYVQSTFHTHPVYRIRSQVGPDHSKLFLVEVMVGRRVLGEGRGPNKKEAEQAAARDAMEQVADSGGRRAEEREPREPRTEERGRREPREPRTEERGRREPREPRTEEHGRREAREPRTGEREGRERREARVEPTAAPMVGEEEPGESRRGRRGGRGRRRSRPDEATGGPAIQVPLPPSSAVPAPGELEPRPHVFEEDDLEEVGRPEGPLDEYAEGPFETGSPAASAAESGDGEEAWEEEGSLPADDEDDRGGTAIPTDETDVELAGEEPVAGLDAAGVGETEEPAEPAWPDTAGSSAGSAPPDAPPASPQFGRKRQRRR